MNEPENFEKVLVDCDGRHIQFFHAVESSSVLEVFKHLDILERSSKKPITITICSEGGDICVGLALYDRIRSCKCHVTTIGTGIVGSIATIIFLAGDKRVASKTCRVMIHQGSIIGNDGPVLHTRAEQNELEDLEEITNVIVAERTGLSKECIEEMVSKSNKYISAEEAMELGFVHEIIQEVQK